MTIKKPTCKTRQTVANVPRSILVLKTQTEKSSNSLRKSGHILIQFQVASLITGSIILARFCGAFLDVGTAVLTLIPRPTHTLIVVD